jgi:hypothetical protein
MARVFRLNTWYQGRLSAAPDDAASAAVAAALEVGDEGSEVAATEADKADKADEDATRPMLTDCAGAARDGVEAPDGDEVDIELNSSAGAVTPRAMATMAVICVSGPYTVK